ncbi:uncharacterized protein J3R85_005418 [Psidium guajava]|nr:uncharacterized protein J3R85_005418 [Psidium guajava]
MGCSAVGGAASHPPMQCEFKSSSLHCSSDLPRARDRALLAC